MTAAEDKALSLIEKYITRYGEAIRPAEFARLMWPDSPSHRHASLRRRSVGINLKAGALLRSLWERGHLRMQFTVHGVAYNEPSVEPMKWSGIDP